MVSIWENDFGSCCWNVEELVDKRGTCRENDNVEGVADKVGDGGTDDSGVMVGRDDCELNAALVKVEFVERNDEGSS